MFLAFSCTLCIYKAELHLSINVIVRFVDETVEIGLLTGGDESAHREEVQRLSDWCTENNLAPNTTNTKELIIDFRKNQNVDSVTDWGTCLGCTPLLAPWQLG